MLLLDDNDRTTNIPTYEDLSNLNLFLTAKLENLVSIFYGVCCFSFYKKSYTPLENEETIFIRTLLHVSEITVYFDDLIGIDIIDTWYKVGSPILGDVIIYSIDGSPLNTSLKMCINERMYIGLTNLNYNTKCSKQYLPIMLTPTIDYIERLQNMVVILRHK